MTPVDLQGPLNDVAFWSLVVVHLLTLGTCATLAIRWWRASDAEDRRRALPLAGIVAVALVTRFIAPGVPHDINPRLMDLWLRFDSGFGYGWGLPSLARGVLLVSPHSEQAIFGTLAALGALSVVPWYVFARQAGFERRDALWGVGMLAITPLHIRFSHTDLQAIPEGFYTALALIAAERFVRTRQMVPALAAAATMAVACQMRPEAAAVGIVALVWMLRDPRRFPWTAPGTWAALGLFAALVTPHVLLVLAKTAEAKAAGQGFGPVFLNGRFVHPALDNGLRELVIFNPEYTPWLLIIGFAAGITAPGAPLSTRLWLAFAATFLAGLVPWWSSLDHVLTIVRHQIRALPFAALLAGLGLSYVGSWVSGRGGLVLGALLVAGVAKDLPMAWYPTTMTEEYTFFSRTLQTLPEGCDLVTFIAPDDGGLYPQTHLSKVFDRDDTWHTFGQREVETFDARGPCAFYYRPANCYYWSVRAEDPATTLVDGMRHECIDFEARFRLEPLAEADLVNLNHSIERYARDPVRVGFYAVHPLAGP